MGDKSSRYTAWWHFGRRGGEVNRAKILAGREDKTL